MSNLAVTTETEPLDKMFETMADAFDAGVSVALREVDRLVKGVADGH